MPLVSVGCRIDYTESYRGRQRHESLAANLEAGTHEGEDGYVPAYRGDEDRMYVRTQL